ncbi:hypothetical protein A0H81_12578 [Grifola frondosa]|uniref:Alpha/beta hydrolase fold-3 domain-containing protein n=1 Tax=Grifola frondosa TaxID=5627 RepID=A0A1C7LRV9_GRIFR|nr:hypothetical protein A0H81_12578 [Grifola frondosa]
MPPKTNYEYQQDMPFSREPLKTLYVWQRLFTTIVMVPGWVLYYAVQPRSSRPRASWSLKQIVAVNFMRRIFKVTELAGVTWCTRDPSVECDNRKLKYTRFEWVDPLPIELRTGIVADPQVPFKRVGTFVWPKESPPTIPHSSGDSQDVLVNQGDEESEAGKVPLIGIFLHGGGYCHMSAHEKASTSKIPHRLIKDKTFTEIHAVEYRLLQHAPFPAAVQDAATVYAHIVRRYQRRPANSSSLSQQSSTTDTLHNSAEKPSYLTANCTEQTKLKKENDAIRHRVMEAARNMRCKIILIGDSAGGNLVLALARWIRDEGLLPPPEGLLLLSPSCDPSHAFPEPPSSYIPRPHGGTDYLVDTPEPARCCSAPSWGTTRSRRCTAPFAQTVADLTIARLDTAVIRHLRSLESVPITPPIMPSAELDPPSTANVDLERSPTSLAHPVIASPRGLSLFSEFPRVCVVLGDAERLEREVMKLVGAMERDGVVVRTVWVEDGVHDVLMMGWWDERVRDRVWASVQDWVRGV